MTWIKIDHPQGYWIIDDPGWIFTSQVVVPPSGVEKGLVFSQPPPDYIYLGQEFEDRAEGAIWRKRWAHPLHAWFHPAYND